MLGEMSKHADHELPQIDDGKLALAFLAVTLERRMPGFLDDWETLATDPTVHAEIRKLREPPITLELTENLRAAVVLVRHTRLVALAWIAEKRRLKHRKR